MARRFNGSNAFDVPEQEGKHIVRKDLRLRDPETNAEYDQSVRANTTPGDFFPDKFNPEKEWMPLIKGNENHDYSDNDFPDLNNVIDKLNRTLNIYEYGNSSLDTEYNKLINRYNRFKVPLPNIELQNAFAHVFFTRPECNVMALNNSEGGYGNLHNQFQKDSVFDLAFRREPNLVKELSATIGPNGSGGHKFMFLLSNTAKGFALNDEEIQSDTYGRTYTGYKISYGRNNVESRTAGNFQVNFGDDRDLHIYRLHKLWVEYISGVYRGRYRPRDEYIMEKTLDYTCAVYYIMTDETGEKILFWSKYYGVYPTTIPSSQYSWESDTPLRPSNLQINYNYSYKQDYDPFTLTEFNLNAGISNHTYVDYVPTYDPNLFHVGTTWVGTPFIEKVNIGGNRFDYYLRFKT